MKNIYDKLLLVVAALALLVGIVFYVLKSGIAPQTGSFTVTSPFNSYDPVPVPELYETDSAWPEPSQQSSGWVYDVFTPPKIYLDEYGQFSAEGWAPALPPVPFGVHLAELARKPYRIQFEGYIEEDLSDPSKSLLLLFDEERQKQIRLRPGESNGGAALEILDFELVRDIDADTSTVKRFATATLLDERSGEIVKLVHGERLYDSEVTVVLVSDDDPSHVFEVKEVGASFELPSGIFSLREVNLEENTVSVEKQSSDGSEVELRKLFQKNMISDPSAPEILL